jgi:hypothetical protein
MPRRAAALCGVLALMNTPVLAGCTDTTGAQATQRPDTATSTLTRTQTSSPSASTPGAPMQEQEFWHVIERAHAAAHGDVDEMADALKEQLAGYSKQQLVDFETVLVSQSRKLYTTRHLAAAELVCGYLGDDGFTDYRSWVIAQGQAVFEAFLADPQSLADLPNLGDSCEGAELFAAAVDELYEKAGGMPGDDEDYPIIEQFDAPDGQPMSEADARKAFPRLVNVLA